MKFTETTRLTLKARRMQRAGYVIVNASLGFQYGDRVITEVVIAEGGQFLWIKTGPRPSMFAQKPRAA